MCLAYSGTVIACGAETLWGGGVCVYSQPTVFSVLLALLGGSRFCRFDPFSLSLFFFFYGRTFHVTLLF